MAPGPDGLVDAGAVLATLQHPKSVLVSLMAALRDRLLAGLMRRIEGVQLNGAREPRLPGNLHVSMARAEAETLILCLGGHLAISSGAACAEAEGQGSHVLCAMRPPDERIDTALRFGIGRYNTEIEMDTAVDVLAEAVQEACARSPAASA